MEKISTILAARQLKPADLARMTGISPSRLSKWFGGEGVVSAHQALLIARALNVPLEWLADPESSPTPSLGWGEDERTIRKIIDAIGTEEAIRRLSVPKVIPPFDDPEEKPGPGEGGGGPGRKR